MPNLPSNDEITRFDGTYIATFYIITTMPYSDLNIPKKCVVFIGDSKLTYFPTFSLLTLPWIKRAGSQFDRLTIWPVDQLNSWPVELLTSCSADQMTRWTVDLLTSWPVDLFSCSPIPDHAQFVKAKMVKKENTVRINMFELEVRDFHLKLPFFCLSLHFEHSLKSLLPTFFIL